MIEKKISRNDLFLRVCMNDLRKQTTIKEILPLVKHILTMYFSVMWMLYVVYI